MNLHKAWTANLLNNSVFSTNTIDLIECKQRNSLVSTSLKFSNLILCILILLEAIVNLFSYEKYGTLFCIKKLVILSHVQKITSI